MPEEIEEPNIEEQNPEIEETPIPESVEEPRLSPQERLQQAKETAGRVDEKLLGGRGQQAIDTAKEKAKEEALKTKPGQAVKKGLDQVEAAKQKAKEKVGEAGKAAAKKLGVGAAKEGAKKGVEAAAGAATGGAAAAGIEAAEKGGKAVSTAARVLDRFFGGHFDRFWRKNKWKVIASGCALFALLMIMPFVLLIALIMSIFSANQLDPDSATDQAAVAEIRSLNSTGQLVFLDSRDLETITDFKNADQPFRPVINLLVYLGERHTLAIARYSHGDPTGNRLGTTATLPETSQSAISIAAADYLKCASPDGTVKITLPVNLSTNFDWASEIKPENLDKKLTCALGYYPGIEPVVKGPFSTLGPGEFSYSDLASLAPRAAQEKLAEVITEILEANNKTGATVDAENNLLPETITIDRANYTAIAAALQTLADSAYQNFSGATGLTPSDTNAFGLQIDFFGQ